MELPRPLIDTYSWIIHVFVLTVLLGYGLLTADSTGAESTRRQYDHSLDLPSRDPLIIAHRGASGDFPEHTLEAYRRAIIQGADVIECDISVTRDLHLVCLHDSWLTTTTNAPDVFPASRMRTYYIPDHDKPQNITDYFAPDFTLEELKTLKVKQRFPHRNRKYDGRYQIPTLEEFIKVARDASPRVIGITPEVKNPMFINAHGTLQEAGRTVHELLVPILTQHGYTGRRDPCLVQSFHMDTLRAVSALTNLPLLYLTRMEPPWAGEEEPGDRGAGKGLSDAELKEAAGFCYGIGPHKSSIVTVDADNTITGRTDLVQRAHDLGLKVMPYTFRNDDDYLPWDYGKDPSLEMVEFMQIGVDGYFTDFPRTAKHVIKLYGLESEKDSECHYIATP